ncbi:MAG: hydrogenase/urease maturation nickel metallochaperone HypA [Candidatus Micrarchaeota archaeon]|nr:hydrogenase/urease maturation nickel metallochaperone HypA [Candidatus Micrarchaeota archaeon]
MHEIALAEKIAVEAEKRAKAVKGVVVEVGELAGVTGEEIVEALKFVRPAWKVTVAEKKAVVECGACGFRGAPKIVERAHDFVVFECPKCGTIPKALEGAEIILKKVIFV